MRPVDDEIDGNGRSDPPTGGDAPGPRNICTGESDRPGRDDCVVGLFIDCDVREDGLCAKGCPPGGIVVPLNEGDDGCVFNGCEFVLEKPPSEFGPEKPFNEAGPERPLNEFGLGKPFNEAGPVPSTGNFGNTPLVLGGSHPG